MGFLCDDIFIINIIMVTPLSSLLSHKIYSTKRAAMNRMQSAYVKSGLVCCISYVYAGTLAMLLRIFARANMKSLVLLYYVIYPAYIVFIFICRDKTRLR